MKKPAPRNEPGVGEANGKSKHSNTAPLSLLQISPAAVASLACLQRLRFDYDCWNALGRPDRMPQPSDFGLNLPPLNSVEVLWRSEGV